MAQPFIIQDSQSLAAGISSNVIAANNSLRRFLRAPFRGRGKLVAVASGAGLRIDFDYGSKNVVNDAELRVATAPQEPDDIINDEFYIEEGDQFTLRANNTSGGALTLRYRFELQPWEDGGEMPPDCRVMQRGPVSVAAAAVDQQLLDGLRYERPPVDSILNVYMAASALGLLAQLNVDTQGIAPPSALTLSNAIPRDPFDTWIRGVEVPADKQIELPVSNPTAGALNVFWKVKLYEMVRS